MSNVAGCLPPTLQCMLLSSHGSDVCEMMPIDVVLAADLVGAMPAAGAGTCYSAGGSNANGSASRGSAGDAAAGVDGRSAAAGAAAAAAAME